MKEKAKIYMLAELIKDLSLKDSFLDSFAEALEKSQKKKILLKNFDEIIKGLELGLGTRIAIALSLSLSNDEAIKQKGISYLKLRLKEYNESDKTAELPDYLVLAVTRFVYSSDQLGMAPEEIKTWMDHNSRNFKNSINQPLSLIVSPTDSSLLDSTNLGSLDISEIDISPSLKDLMFELGPLATADEQKLILLLSELDKLTERDIIDTINMMVENSPFVEPESTNKELSKLAKQSFLELVTSQRVEAPDSTVPAAASEPKNLSTWNYATFIKVISETKKISWQGVFKQMDNPEFHLSSKRAFQEFVQICEIIRDTQKVMFPREMFVGKWDNIRAQLNFIHRFIEFGRTDISIYKDLKNKNLVDYDTTPSVRNTPAFTNGGMEIWVFKDFVVRLIELSESNHYNTVRGYFEAPIKRYPQIVLATLSQLNPKKGCQLVEDIYFSIFSDLLDNNPTSHVKIIDYVAKNNLELLAKTFADICKKETNSLSLSRILDVSQTSKTTLQKLVSSEDHEFSIPLGLFACKREFLNIRTWVKERIESSGERFIEALIEHIRKRIVAPMKLARNEEASNPPSPNLQRKLDQIFDAAHLNSSSLNILMEMLHQLIASSKEIYSEKVTRKIEEVRGDLAKGLPEWFTPTSTNETEKESNKILTDIYEGRTTLEEFIRKMAQIKDSQIKQEQEIYACIVHHLLIEYPNYIRQSKQAVELNGRIFGQLIKNDLLSQTTYKVCYAAILDALKKKDKFLLMGLAALQEVKAVVHQNLSVCKNIFAIDQLRANHADILKEIVNNLKAAGTISGIKESYVKEVELNSRAKESVPVVQPPIVPNKSVQPVAMNSKPNAIQTMNGSGNQSGRAPAGGNAGNSGDSGNPDGSSRANGRGDSEGNGPSGSAPPPGGPPGNGKANGNGNNGPNERVLYVNLATIEKAKLKDEIKKLVDRESKDLKVPDEDKKEQIFIINNLDKGSLQIRADGLSAKLGDNKDSMHWLSINIVFERVPTASATSSNFASVDLYNELVTRINKKPLSKQVLTNTYQLANLMFEYSCYKKVLESHEMSLLRSSGVWIGLVTLSSNKPIIKRELDPKYWIYTSFEQKSLKGCLPMVIEILKTSNAKSAIFKLTNPYIMGILGLLIEIKNDHSKDQNQAQSMIESLFSDMKVVETDVKHFHYMLKKKNLKQRPMSPFKTLPDQIKLDTITIQSMATGETTYEGAEQQLRQLVAIAIDCSIEEITKPHILKRSVEVALATTRELVLKDFAYDGDEEKLTKAAEAMVVFLAGNLSQATMTDVLKARIKDYLVQLLRTQTRLDEVKLNEVNNLATIDNIDLASNYVKNIVINRALQDLAKDQAFIQAVQSRKKHRNAQQSNSASVSRDYVDEKYVQIGKELPVQLKPNSKGLTPNEIQVYQHFKVLNSPKLQSENAQLNNRRTFVESQNAQQFNQTHTAPPTIDIDKIRKIIDEIEVQITKPAQEERYKGIHLIYNEMGIQLRNCSNIEESVAILAKEVLEKMFRQSIHHNDKFRCYSDVLMILGNFNPKISKIVTSWYFENDFDQKFTSSIVIPPIRRNLIHLADFDTGFAAVLDTVDNSKTAPLICIVDVLKYIVIEQRLFSIHTFKKIIEKIVGIKQKRFYHSLPEEVTMFIDNLHDFIKQSQEYVSSIQFRLTSIEPEYKKLLNDVAEYFTNPDYGFYRQSITLFKSWLSAGDKVEMRAVIKEFEDEFVKKSEKSTIPFFCYLIDVSCRQAERCYESSRRFAKIDYTFIDNVSKFAIILLCLSSQSHPNFRITILERVLTALIIVITKEHHYNPQNFNNKLFFKFLFNILFDLNIEEYGFAADLKGMLNTILQALHIIQPIKYPGFAFAWLQLISSKYLIAPILREEGPYHDGSMDRKDTQTQYTQLILDLLIFYKEVFNIRQLNTAEMKQFYKGTLRLLLVLLHDFPDFLCNNCFALLEEIPETFMQVRNIMASAYPKGMRIPNPFEHEAGNTRLENDENYSKLPVSNPKVEERITCHNLHNVIMNCIKHPDRSEFEHIKKSFYISGYRNEPSINKMLLDSFVLYVPYWVFNQNNDPSDPVGAMDNYKKESYTLFIRLLKDSNYEFRDALMSSILNNLRFPNPITFYFLNLILTIFGEVDSDKIHEQLVRNLFERLIIEKPHPWGTLYLLDIFITDRTYTLSNLTFYKANEESMKYLLELVMDFVHLYSLETPEDEEAPVAN